MITLLLRQNDVATSFWRHNDVIISSCARWVNASFKHHYDEIYPVHFVVCWFLKLCVRWLQAFTEGYANKMRRFHVKSDADKDDAIVVRIHGTVFAEIQDRKQEFLTVQVKVFMLLIHTVSWGGRSRQMVGIHKGTQWFNGSCVTSVACFDSNDKRL